MVSQPEDFLDREHPELRTPPHSAEAEQAVIGGLLLDNGAWDRIADVIRADDFYRRDHRLIYDAFGDMVESGEACDAVTLSEHLESKGTLDDAGGLAYLGRLVQDTPTAANILAYARIVRDRSLLRGLIRIGGEISADAYTPEGRSPQALVEEAEKRIYEIAETGRRGGKGFISLKKLLPKALDKLDELFHSDGELTGVSTGFKELDRKTAGLQKGDLIVVAGRPSMGKTSLAMNIAENAAIRGEVPTAIFSMEMGAEQLAMRMISSLGRINQANLRTGSFKDEDWHRINGAVQMMSNMPLYIDDTPALTPTEIRSRARRMSREHGLGLVVVDYLQLMQVAGTKENRATEISEISRGLKALAKELEVPVIALSQLNRSVEQRNDKRPVMSDLRESGAIEQDADLICFIYRDEVYNPETNRKGVADIIIAKQRNGPIGEVPLTFLGEFTKFENFAPESFSDEGF